MLNLPSNRNLRFLRTVTIFSELSDMLLWYICQRMKLIHFSKKEVIVREGSDGNGCFFIRNGSVKVTRVNREDRSILLSVLRAGDFFGELSMLDGGVRSANVVAQEDTDILVLSHKYFLQLLNDAPSVSVQLLKDLALRMRKCDEQIVNLTLNSAKKRIGACLLQIAEDQGTVKQGSVIIKKFPFQHDIANMSSVSRETVNQVIGRFEKEGVILRKDRALTICNYSEFKREFE